MKVLIIGGSGFIGRHVSKHLMERGNEVINFHRGQTKTPARAEILGEISELETFREEFSKLRPDVVIDMIAMNENDAQILLSTFAGLVPRLVVISSSDVYRNYNLMAGIEEDEPDPRPLAETSPLRTQFFRYRKFSKEETDRFYNYEKILVERTVMSSPDITTTVLRLPAVYGPGDRQHRLFPYIKRMDDQRPGIIVDSGMMNWSWTRGYVENVAAAISWAAGDQSPASRIYNVGEKNGLPEKEWIAAIAQVIGWVGSVIPVENSDLPEQMRSHLRWQHRLETDTSLIRAQPDFTEPVDFLEGIRRTVEWERANPPEMKPEDFDYQLEDQVLSSLPGNRLTAKTAGEPEN
jgi:nucleoside-diphosphate-sugar epimerase